MRWFFDTEFHEDGNTIDLISIALVNEDFSQEYYAVSTEFNEGRCNGWLQENVIANLPPRNSLTWKSRQQIANEICALVGPNPEYWGYYIGYDWVALCQLYGRMVDLPKRMQGPCFDIKQEMTRLGLKKSDLLPIERPHDALEDAIWARAIYLFMQGRPEPAREARQRTAIDWIRNAVPVPENELNERCARLLEETLEFVQAADLPASDAHALVDYVYSRYKGDIFQEAGGVALTLMAACATLEFSAEWAEIVELKRVLGLDPAKFRERHAAKVAAGVASGNG